MVEARDPASPQVQASGSATLFLQVLPTATGMPSSGLYGTPQFAESQIVKSTVQYSSAPDADGIVQPLLMDVFVPPDAARSPRPTIIDVHGGSFVGGSRTDNDGDRL